MIEIKSIEGFAEHFNSLQRELLQNGFVTVRLPYSSDETLSHVASFFGNPLHHPRANKLGIAYVTPATEEQISELPVARFGLSQDAFSLHTDGAFLASPPSHFLLLCSEPAHSGGANILVDTKPVVEELRRSFPHLMDLLSQPIALDFTPPKMAALSSALFSVEKNHSFRLRFREDFARPRPWAKTAFDFVVNRFFRNREIQKKLTLSKNELLIVDNFRILHGRERFETLPGAPARLIKKIWIEDGSLDAKRCASA